MHLLSRVAVTQVGHVYWDHSFELTAAWPLVALLASAAHKVMCCIKAWARLACHIVSAAQVGMQGFTGMPSAARNADGNSKHCDVCWQTKHARCVRQPQVVAAAGSFTRMLQRQTMWQNLADDHIS